MGVEDWSTDESQNLELDGSDISRRASPGAPANELTRKLMAHVKELEEKIVSDGIAVDGITIENNSGTLTVKDVAIDGDTTDLLTAKIAEIEAAATQAGEDAEAAQTAATQAAASATSATSAITSASTAANAAAEQADIAARAAARAQSGAAMAESAVQAVISGTNLNWQRSEKAGAVAVYPVPETALESTVDFLFAETPPASGDKGPENPSTISGVSSVKVTRCGKNLFERASDGTATSNGLTLVRHADGTCTLSGTATANTFFYINSSNLIQAKAGLTYTLSGCPSGGSYSTYRLACATTNAGTTHYYLDYGSGVSSSKPFDAKWQMYIYIASGVVFSTPVIFKPQFELGSNATSFEPYESTAYTIDLGSTYYGGSVDLGAGLITVTHRYFEVDPDVVTISCNVGYEATNTSACYFYPLPQRAAPRACAWSNRFITDDTIGSLMTDVEMVYTGSGATGILLRINKTRLGASYDATDKTAIEAAWKAWLRANPTYVAYQLATPYAVQLTPLQIYSLSQPDPYTPRLNTVYSDQVSVQVGYPKSPQATSTELTNAIISLGGEI